MELTHQNTQISESPTAAETTEIAVENDTGKSSPPTDRVEGLIVAGDAKPYRVDQYFSSRLPAMPAASFLALKSNIERDGRIRNPLVAWKEGGVLLDGHHRDAARDELIVAGLKIPLPDITWMSFSDEAEAVCWMIRNQDGTRPQWSPWEKLKLLWADKRLMAGLKAHAKARQVKNAKSPKSDEPTADFRTVLAEMLGVVRSTADKLWVVINDPSMSAAVDKGELSANQAADQIAERKKAEKAKQKVTFPEPTEDELLDVLGRPEMVKRIQTGMYTPAHAVKSLNGSKIATRITVQSLAVRTLPKYDLDGLLNQITCCDALEGLKALPDDFVDLTVTSPPYPLPFKFYRYWDYEGLFGCDYQKYLAWIELHFHEIFRATKNGGQFCVNIDNCYDAKLTHSGLRVRNNCFADFCGIAEKVGFHFSDRYVWMKQNAVSNRVLMGGKRHVRSQSNCEDVIVFYKGNPTLDDSLDDLTPTQQHKLSMQAWYIKPVTSKKKWKGTAPFPLELPGRCIRLYSQRTQVVLDPFSGSGTTCTAATLLGRQFIGFEKDEKLVGRSMRRVRKAIDKAKAKAAEPITVEQVITETGRADATKHYLGQNEYVSMKNAKLTEADVQEIINEVISAGETAKEQL